MYLEVESMKFKEERGVAEKNMNMKKIAVETECRSKIQTCSSTKSYQ